MRKYYFGYHLVYGDPYPFAWVEIDGILVGGRPDYVKGTKVEISSDEFEQTLLTLASKYPWIDSLPNVLEGKST